MTLMTLARDAVGERGVEPVSTAGPASRRLARYAEERVGESGRGYAEGTIATAAWRIMRYSRDYQNLIMRLGATPAIWRAGDFVVVPIMQRETMHFVLVALDSFLPKDQQVRSGRLEPRGEDTNRAFEVWAEQALSARGAEHRFALVGATDPDIIEEFSRSQGFFVAVAPAASEFHYTSGRPTPPFEIKDGTNTPTFSMGTLAWRTPHGDGVTTAAHGVVSGTNYDIHHAAHGWLDHVHGVVTNAVLDAAFLQTHKLHSLAYPVGKTILSGVTPNKQLRHEFYGASSGPTQATVTGWVDDLLTIQPWLQNRVFTDPILQGGDSGSALIDANDNIVGFAFYNDPFAATARSAWIWADSVRVEFGL